MHILAPQGISLDVEVTDADGNVSTETFFPQFITSIGANLDEQTSVKAYLSNSVASQHSYYRNLSYDFDSIDYGGTLSVSGHVLVDQGTDPDEYESKLDTAKQLGRDTLNFLLGSIKGNWEIDWMGRTIKRRPLRQIKFTFSGTYTFNRCRCIGLKYDLTSVNNLFLHTFSLDYHFETVVVT